ncbi:MAG TPA: MmcQ/YjbR family DNA-binding protein [Candidatus Dormibacteraeota bacterium]
MRFPEAVEQEHFGNPSFRVRGRIFATVPDDTHLNVMIDPFDVDAVVRAESESCAELLWGKEVRGVRVLLPRASPAMVEELLRVAWKRKAPKRLST